VQRQVRERRQLRQLKRTKLLMRQRQGAFHHLGSCGASRCIILSAMLIVAANTDIAALTLSLAPCTSPCPAVLVGRLLGMRQTGR
jgi:hypothetical protein